MSAGFPANPAVSNTTAALIASPNGVTTTVAVGRPVCRVITPTAATQTATPTGA